MNNCFVEDRVLHVTYYISTLPLELDDLGTLYEGYIENRIGVNLPMKVLKAVLPSHRFCAYDADYIICYPTWDRGQTKRHELYHAKYYMDADYRKRVHKEWENLSDLEREKIQKKLSGMGYEPVVHIDEWQAYKNDGML